MKREGATFVESCVSHDQVWWRLDEDLMVDKMKREGATFVESCVSRDQVWWRLDLESDRLTCEALKLLSSEAGVGQEPTPSR